MELCDVWWCCRSSSYLPVQDVMWLLWSMLDDDWILFCLALRCVPCAALRVMRCVPCVACVLAVCNDAAGLHHTASSRGNQQYFEAMHWFKPLNSCCEDYDWGELSLLPLPPLITSISMLASYTFITFIPNPLWESHTLSSQHYQTPCSVAYHTAACG